MEGKTSVPVREAVELLASHGSSMVIFLTAGMIGELSSRLINGGFEPDAPAAIVSRATWDDEQVIRTTVAGLPAAAKAANITKTALITVGGFLAATPTDYDRSKLYDPEFTTEFRPATR
jgi:precorrin-4/cobalt-precorrin-4 C11-methyltransferase